MLPFLIVLRNGLWPKIKVLVPQKPFKTLESSHLIRKGNLLDAPLLRQNVYELT